MSRNNLETEQASIIKLVRPVASRNFLNRARRRKVHRDHWRGHHAGWVSPVERYRTEMAGSPAGRHSNRARTFVVLFPRRYLYRCQRCVELAVVALLNFPTLISHNGDSANVPTLLGVPLCPSCEIQT